MGTSPDQLRNEIEQTRAGLTHNVDTLAEKVSPSSVAHRRMDDAKERFSGVKEKVMGSTHSATSRMSETGSSLSDRASDMGSSLSDRASDMGSSLSDRASSVSDSVTSAPQAARARTQGNPFAAGLIAFGAGLLASSLLPATQREQQAATTLKEKAQPLAKDTAQQLKESMTPVAQDAVQQVKTTAQDAAATTKEQATSAAGEVADHAKSAAGDTKSDVAEHASDAKSQLQGGSGDSAETTGATVYPSDPLIETEAPTHPNFVR